MAILRVPVFVKKYLIRRAIPLLTLVQICLIFIILKRFDVSTLQHSSQVNSQFQANLYKSNHFLTSSALPHPYAGVGNQLFIAAAIYGIAKRLDRTVFINSHELTTNHEPRIAIMTRLFPKLSAQIYNRIAINRSTLIVAQYGDNFAKYSPIESLFEHKNDKYLYLSGEYFQSYKYFHRYKHELTQLLAFSDSDRIESKRLAAQMIDSDDNRKLLCVHIRRGDFVENDVLEHSTETFIARSIEFLWNRVGLREQNYSIVLMGVDYNWIDRNFLVENSPIRINAMGAKIYNRKLEQISDRSETIDFAFARDYCNSILLTATASTFGWWLAYLSNADAVYFNQKFFKDDANNDYRNAIAFDDYILPNYIALYYNESQKRITMNRIKKFL